jgi:transcriptional regulator with XRE-family HTH domain
VRDFTRLSWVAKDRLKLSKVAQTVLDDFGRAVKRARSLNGWTLDQLAVAMAGNAKEATGKSFLSNIEKGKRDISATTVGKLIKALHLDEDWIDRFLDADIAPDDEETEQDQQAERLLRMHARDATAPESAEGLLIGLAEKFSAERFIDHFTAYASLKSALETAAEMKARGALPQNTDSQLTAVMREVARLNDEGLFDDAAAALDAEMQRIEADREAVFHQQLNQDRIRNRPEDAAKRITENLKRSAPAGGVFIAGREKIADWRKRGDLQSDPFDLEVALALAKENHSRAKGSNQGAAIDDLGCCYREVGERRMQDDYTKRAVAAHKDALKMFTGKKHLWNRAATQINLGIALRNLGARQNNSAYLRSAIAAHNAAIQFHTNSTAPNIWATAQNNLGVAHWSLGELEEDPGHLRAAIIAYQVALTVQTREVDSMKWAGTQNNIGLAFRWLGALEKDEAVLTNAGLAYELCLEEHTQEQSPFHWAMTQWNLADLALAKHHLAPNPAQIKIAFYHVTEARKIFVDGSDHQTARCDELLALIAALET